MKNGKENNFNYNIIYYKVTNKEECHHGYQYRDGLNILKEKFNSDPNDSCGSGGFYFTEYKNLPDYFNLGVHIREVSIPRDAQVLKDIKGDKWRTDKIILGKRYKIKEDFDKWFNAEEFNWKFGSDYLAEYCSEHFDKWFDAEKFNWGSGSRNLAMYCSEYFDKWFDPEKFNWEFESRYLAIYCSDKFDKWFDADKLNWEIDSRYLAKHCFDKFNQWFDPEKFNWKDSYYLAKYCSEHFNKWFDAEKFNWDYGLYDLVEYCPDKFEQWFDPKKFDFGVEDKEYLGKFCSKYKHIWGKYITKKTIN